MTVAHTRCSVTHSSPEVKERWLETLHRKVQDRHPRAGGAPPPPDVLMKVLSGSVPSKSLTGGGMEQFIQLPLDTGDAKTPSNHQEDKLTLASDKRWNQVVRRLKKGSSFMGRAGRVDPDARTRLFGRPLSNICPDGCSLPRPLTEMLVQLRKRGPSTEGVFRKPCNSKNMKEVREQLNAGLELDLSLQPVALLVGLLKSFLKELPGSLLVSELYLTWTWALERQDAERRALEIRKVVDEQLPAHNKLLLQHLACVLHHILQSAHINKMDAHNLAVCIAPTLLQLDGAPLDEQKEKMKKLTELTEILIKHHELLGENIPSLLDTDEDSVSSQHHDSAYDSTDPDGDVEAGESSAPGAGGSSSSLSPSWGSASALHPKPPVHRRCSEPIILTPPDLEGLCGHARSHEDCSVERRGLEERPLKKPASSDSFLLRDGRRPVLSLPKQPRPASLASSGPGNCSCSSLESAASNQSDGSVFTGSPAGSPACPRRAPARPEPARPVPDDKRPAAAAAARAASKVLLRTRSLGAFGRSSLKKEAGKEGAAFPCATLPEDSQSEAEPAAQPPRRPRPLSAVEVFKQADGRLPCRPPSYRQALQSVALPPLYGAMTVQDAMERRSRPSSVSYDFPPACPAAPFADCFPQESAGAGGVELRHPFRQRAMSESVSKGQREAASRRCSQPVFEELSYTKESYV